MAKRDYKVDEKERIVYIYEDENLTPQESDLIDRYVRAGNYRQVIKKRGLTLEKMRQKFKDAGDIESLKIFNDIYRAKKENPDDEPGFYHATAFYNEWKKRLKKQKVEAKEAKEAKKADK